MTVRQTKTFTTTVDGHAVTFKFVKRGTPRTVWPRRGRPYTSPSWREYQAKPRLYVNTSGETLLDNLANRTTRPYNEWRKPIKAAIIKLRWNNVRLTWSQKAGCSMCPCSPGFIVSLAPSIAFADDDGPTDRYDVWVTIADAPVARDDDEARALQAARAAAVSADPTLPDLSKVVL